jgi:hypothetical protein
MKRVFQVLILFLATAAMGQDSEKQKEEQIK